MTMSASKDTTSLTLSRLGNTKSPNVWSDFGLLAILISIAYSMVLALTLESLTLYWILVAGLIATSFFLSSTSVLVMALSIWAFLPTEYISLNPFQNFLNPASLLLLVLLVKTNAKVKGKSLAVFFLFFGYLMVATLYSIDPVRSAAWSFQVTLLLYVAFSSYEIVKSINPETVLKALAIVCSFLFIVAVLEYLRSKSLIYNGSFFPDYYESWKWEYFSVFRIRTTLGHPLNNGLFFAVAALIFLRSGVVKGSSRIFVVLVLICAVAVFLSASRSALATLAGSAILLFLFDWRKVAFQVKLWLVLLTPTVFTIFAQSTFFTRIFSRNGSNEGVESSLYRSDLLQWSRYFTQDYFFQGVGPGASDKIWPTFGSNNPLENGFFQLWVSLGLIPTVVCLCFVTALLVRQLKTNLTSLLCLMPAIAYLPLTNFMDSCSSFMSFISLFIVISLFPQVGSQNDFGEKS